MANKFKIRMSFDEMAEAFAEHNPAFRPNRNNVGRFAKRHGYKRTKQQTNYELEYFYVKASN